MNETKINKNIGKVAGPFYCFPNE